MYIEYFMEVMRHKKEVFKNCWKQGLYKEAFMHDMSKFLPSEFIPYAKWFKGDRGTKLTKILDGLDEEVKKEYEINKQNFERAVQKHYKRNKHHWNHWTNDLFYEDIPDTCLQELVCDWMAVGKKYGNSPQEYYLRNYYQINMTDENRWKLELALGFRNLHEESWDPWYDKTMDYILCKVYDYNDIEGSCSMFNNKYRLMNERYNFDTAALMLKSKQKKTVKTQDGKLK